MFYKLCLAAAFALFSLNAQAAQEAAAEAGGERVENDYYNCLQAASGYSDDVVDVARAAGARQSASAGAGGQFLLHLCMVTF